jgi:hypothetical protein
VLNPTSGCITSNRISGLILTTPWSRVLLEKLVVTRPVKFPAFNGTWRFITVYWHYTRKSVSHGHK